MALKDNLPDKIWVDGILWDVVSLISFEEYVDNDYILLKRQHPELAMTEMILIDPHDTTFYPDTEEVRSKMKLIIDERNHYEFIKAEIKDSLTNTWLEIFD